MTLPFEFPDWMPGWLGVLVLIFGILVGLAFLMMPFATFGVKSRIAELDTKIDDLQSELRTLANRIPEPARTPYDTPALIRAAEAAPQPPAIRPAPIPPPPPTRESLSPTLRAAARLASSRDRTEPRLNRPR